MKEKDKISFETVKGLIDKVKNWKLLEYKDLSDEFEGYLDDEDIKITVKKQQDIGYSDYYIAVKYKGMHMFGCNAPEDQEYGRDIKKIFNKIDKGTYSSGKKRLEKIAKEK